MDRFTTGTPVSNHAALVPDKARELAGNTVRLRHVDPARDTPALFQASHGPDRDPAQWTYMSYGPFADEAAMRRWMDEMQASRDPLFMTVSDAGSGTPANTSTLWNRSGPRAWPATSISCRSTGR